MPSGVSTTSPAGTDWSRPTKPGNIHENCIISRNHPYALRIRSAAIVTSGGNLTGQIAVHHHTVGTGHLGGRRRTGAGAAIVEDVETSRSL